MSKDGAQLGVRWTIGDVSGRGFEALRRSIWGAWRLFGPRAGYAVCVNSIPIATACERTGTVPDAVAWHQSDGKIPDALMQHLDRGLAEGAAWKLAPLRMFPDRHEISLDNDCVLWAMPEAIRHWLSEPNQAGCVLAEDVAPAFGQFAALCGPEPRNAGIRGLPPGLDLESAVTATLAAHPVRLVSELDEQGLQIAVLSHGQRTRVVTLDEVTICSPFPPHVPWLGTCGAHFVGLNMRRGRHGCDQAVLDRIAAHWDDQVHEIDRVIGLA